MKKSVFFFLAVLSSFLWSEGSHAQNAITYWRNGEPTIIYSPDSIFFWNANDLIPELSEEDEEGGNVEPTETELQIMQMTSDEENAPAIVYSEEDSLKYDAMAQEVLAMFADDDDDFDDSPMSRRKANNLDDEEIQDIIRNNGKNIFEELEDDSKELIIEQQDWDSGQWGKTRYGGFKTYYSTYWEDGKRWLLVVFHCKGGFPNKKTAYLKLGQVNSGKIIDSKPVYPSQENVVISVCIDDYLGEYGCVNFFPLLITEENQARNYLNPVLVKTKPIVPDGWADFPNGKEFGTINGISVCCNTSPEGRNKGSDPDLYKYQCVELCKRYVTKFFAGIKRPYGPGWGNAWNWPELRRDESGQDKGKYIVFANDGSRKVREGDLIVWRWQYWDKKKQKWIWTGHIGVVIKTTPKYISVAHQNGGAGTNALPIGSTLKIENGIVKDIKPGYNVSPIFQTSHPITHFIRSNHFSEDISEDTNQDYASLKASTTKMEFGEVEAGTSKTLTFKVKNSGNSTLTISSVTLSKSKAFSIDASSCTVAPGETRKFNVTFAPTESGEFNDRIIIRSNANDNPEWSIYLYGTGTGTGDNTIVPTTGLVAYYPFNGNANDESGNGNHGTVIGNVELTTDRFGNKNGAYRFPGQPFNYISVTDDESLHISTFTLNAWVYTDGEDYGSGCLICKGRDINNGSYLLGVWSFGAVNLYGGINGAGIEDIPQVKVWHMATGTVEGDKAKFYLDGILMDEKTLSNPFVYGNSEPLVLGMHYYSGVPSYWAYPLLGILDDVRIYNRVLSPSEIESLYREQRSDSAGGESTSYLTCPDDHHPHMIDLGLPSGTKWACCNVGASTPEGSGGYYAWGETSEKSTYDRNTYNCNYDGTDIAGTNYDVARARMGTPWRLPSTAQQQELMDYCSRLWTQKNGVNGILVTGPNEGQIFLPAAGDRLDNELKHSGNLGNYWSSSTDPSNDGSAWYLGFYSGSWSRGSSERHFGLSVRAVRP